MLIYITFQLSLSSILSYFSPSPVEILLIIHCTILFILVTILSSGFISLINSSNYLSTLCDHSHFLEIELWNILYHFIYLSHLDFQYWRVVKFWACHVEFLFYIVCVSSLYFTHLFWWMYLSYLSFLLPSLLLLLMHYFIWALL